MEAQRESFIFHMEYIEGVPEELEAQYAMYAINYARYGKEPKLTDWRDIRMWNKTKQRIDEEAEKYEKRCSNLKNHKKTDTESASNRDRIETESAIENEKSSGVYESDYEFVNEFENESESDAPKVPIRESPPFQAYAQQVYKIFHDAGLPCARSNYISFMQRDFKNGLAYIHKTYGPLHSDDVIGACQNYAKTVNDPESFITGKYSFDRFVTFKNFVDYLPGNYTPENFKDTKKITSADPPKKKSWKQECPGCHAQALEWSNESEMYVCSSCGHKYTYEQITGG